MVIFLNESMSKTNSSPFTLCEPFSTNINSTDIGMYVIDGRFLLLRVIWQKNSSFGCIINQDISCLLNHYASNILSSILSRIP